MLKRPKKTGKMEERGSKWYKMEKVVKERNKEAKLSVTI